MLGSLMLGKLGDSAPIWVPDERVTMCQKCHCDFTFFLRRHHCRACGQVVCYYCSAQKAPLKYRDYKPERVCYDCYDTLLGGKVKSGLIYFTHATSLTRTRRGRGDEVAVRDQGDHGDVGNLGKTFEKGSNKTEIDLRTRRNEWLLVCQRRKNRPVATQLVRPGVTQPLPTKSGCGFRR